MRTFSSLTLLPLSLVLCTGAFALSGCSGADPSAPQQGESVTAATAEDEVADVARSIAYACTSPSLGTIDVTVKVQGTTPKSVAADAKVSMSRFKGTLTISAADVNELAHLRDQPLRQREHVRRQGERRQGRAAQHRRQVRGSRSRRPRSCRTRRSRSASPRRPRRSAPGPRRPRAACTSPQA